VRLNAIVKLQDSGWKIGLRFDPILYFEGYKCAYQSLFKTVFKKIALSSLHSVTLGTFRLPIPIYGNMKKILPSSFLLAQVQEQKQLVSYPTSIQQEMLEFCKFTLLKYIPQEKLFCCSLN
jgi:spore photoproduct lyase